MVRPSLLLLLVVWWCRSTAWVAYPVVGANDAHDSVEVSSSSSSRHTIITWPAGRDRRPPPCSSSGVPSSLTACPMKGG